MSAVAQVNLDSLADNRRSTPIDLVMLLKRAVAESGRAQKVIAIEMGLDPAYLSRMLSGEKPCSLDHLAQLPPRTFFLFFKYGVEAVGGTVNEIDPLAVALSDLHQAILRVLLFSARPQMKKAGV
jgi:hypothetical protein